MIVTRIDRRPPSPGRPRPSPVLRAAPRTLAIRSAVVGHQPRTCRITRPAGRPRDAVPAGAYLPCGGDRTLSVILSKAMLPARDDLITDPTITRQFE
ncbi:DUF7737 domain-containing protein [Streptodolium elevatio]|uniref:DUF7737 domain-containing protein n=1 Tax=Streptodolium elevatio TaxID=3157996 RepID=UPI003F4CC4E5